MTKDDIGILLFVVLIGFFLGLLSYDNLRNKFGFTEMKNTEIQVKQTSLGNDTTWIFERN